MTFHRIFQKCNDKFDYRYTESMEKENLETKESYKISPSKASEISENSVQGQRPTPIFTAEKDQSFLARTLKHVERADDEETVRLFLMQKSKHTVRAYRRVCDEFIEFLNDSGRTLKLASVEDVLNFCSFKNSCANATVVQRAAIIKALFAFGVKAGRLTNNPAILLKLKRVQNKISERNLSEDEVKAMIAGTKSLRDRAFLKLLYVSGCRRFEILNLNLEHCKEREDGSAKITVLGKGGKARTIIVSSSVWSTVKEMMGEDRKSRDPVFEVGYGKMKSRMSESTAYNIVKRAAIRAGILRKVSPHFLRHAHATHALNKGANLKLLQETLGHSSIEMTGKYLHANPEESSGAFLDV